MSTKESERNSSAQETLDSKLSYSNTMSNHSRDTIVLYEISQLLNTQLDKATLATCVGMIENGVNPEALAVCCRLAALYQKLTCMFSRLLYKSFAERVHNPLLAFDNP